MYLPTTGENFQSAGIPLLRTRRDTPESPTAPRLPIFFLSGGFSFLRQRCGTREFHLPMRDGVAPGASRLPLRRDSRCVISPDA
jgi:hypothetical protein